MKFKLYFHKVLIVTIMLIAFSCDNSTNANLPKPIGEKFEIYKDSFDIAQKEENYAVSTEILMRLLSNSEKEEIEIANYLLNECNCLSFQKFLENSGFVIPKTAAKLDFNFFIFSKLYSNSIEIMQKNVKECIPEVNKSAYLLALTISGSTLDSEQQRTHYIQNNVLQSKSIAVEKLSLFSKLYQLDSNLKAVDNALIQILKLADYEVVIGFLGQCGSINFDRHSDEYANYDGSKLAHLSTECKQAIIEILSKSESKTPYSNKRIIEELQKVKGNR